LQEHDIFEYIVSITGAGNLNFRARQRLEGWIEVKQMIRTVQEDEAKVVLAFFSGMQGNCLGCCEHDVILGIVSEYATSVLGKYAVVLYCELYVL
jgi:hypothetical protein